MRKSIESGQAIGNQRMTAARTRRNLHRRQTREEDESASPMRSFEAARTRLWRAVSTGHWRRRCEGRDLNGFRGREGLVVALVVSSLGLTACNPSGTIDDRRSGVADTTSEVALGTCPEPIAERVGDADAVKELDLNMDGSRSFLSKPAATAAIMVQVDKVVDQAIDDEAALRISVFTTTVSSTQPVIDCPNMAVVYANGDTVPQRRRELKIVAHDAVARAMDAAIKQIRAGDHAPGTSVVGGWLMLSALAPASPSVQRREAVMFSDAKGIPAEADVPVDLAGFDAVSLYGVGRSGKETDTTATADLVEVWTAWLTAHGAVDPVVSSGTY